MADFKKYNTADNAFGRLPIVNNSQTTIVLTSSQNLPGTNWIGTMVQFDGSNNVAKKEKIYVSVNSANTLTVTRGFGGDTPQSFNANDYIFLNVVSEVTNDIQNQAELVAKPSVGTLSSNTVKGGVLRCIDDAVGDVARTTAGRVEDEKYGVYLRPIATAISCEFDTAVKRTGKATLKLSTTDITGRGNTRTFIPSTAIEHTKYGAILKPNTKYKVSCFVKTNNVATNSVYVDINEYGSNGVVVGSGAQTNKLSGTNDWTLCTVTFTSNASTVYASINCGNVVAGNISDARFDYNSITIEEVKEDTTSISTPSIPDVIIQGVTTTDNIDQYLDTGGAYANTYTVPVAISETATELQTFTPTKKYITRIGVWVVAKGTGNRTLTVHNSTNVVLGVFTIANASLTDGAFNYFNVPTIWTTGNYHFHITSTVADGTVKCNTASDLETCSFIQNYAKKSEDGLVTINGVKSGIKTDMDGLPHGAIVDIVKGTYELKTTLNSGNSLYNLGFHSTVSSYLSGATNGLWNGNAEYQIKTSGDFVIRKMNFGIVLDSLSIYARLTNNACYFEYSYDGINRNELLAPGGSSSLADFYFNFDIIPSRYIFLRFRTNAGTSGRSINALYVSGKNTKYINTTGLIYPLSINQFSENIKSTIAITRVYFRLSKFANKNGVVMPALEWTDGAGISLGYVNIPIDNSLETNPSIALMSTTTGRQNSGTGTNEATTGYILNDGEYMTISGTPTEMKVDYRVGKGTTAFTNITKNTYYLSSNSQSSDSTQDPSLQANILLNLRSQGIQENIQNTQRELNVIKNELANSYKVVRRTVPVGTTTITETYGASELIIAVPSTASTVTIDLSTKLMTDPNLKIITVVDESGVCSVNNITITTQGAETISGANTFVMNAGYQAQSFYSNGSNWFAK